MNSNCCYFCSVIVVIIIHVIIKQIKIILFTINLLFKLYKLNIQIIVVTCFQCLLVIINYADSEYDIINNILFIYTPYIFVTDTIYV